MANGNFIGANPIYTKGGETTASRKYITGQFRLVKSPPTRGKDGRFLGTKPAKATPFTPNSIVAGAKYTNSIYPDREYFGVSLGGVKEMLMKTNEGGFITCEKDMTLEAWFGYWAAFSLKK